MWSYGRRLDRDGDRRALRADRDDHNTAPKGLPIESIGDDEILLRSSDEDVERNYHEIARALSALGDGVIVIITDGAVRKP